MGIVKALYGLVTSANQWRSCLADFLRSLNFVPSRADRDVWLRLRDSQDGYDYICTHVDDFKIVARNAYHWLNLIQKKFMVKEFGEPSYYLGNDYRQHADSKRWKVGSFTYIKEAIARIERIHGTITKRNNPLPADEHPELDSSPLLDAVGHRQYQTLVGMAQWVVTTARFDVGFATASLSRFGAAPRQRHLELALHLFGYLKKYPNRCVEINCDPFAATKLASKMTPQKFDFSDDYRDAIEEKDPKLPKAYGDELETSIFFDSDHAHDRKTLRSISGILGFVGSTPVMWMSRRQGAIASSTYQAEFYAGRCAVEEAISLRYMLRCLGIKVDNPTFLFGDNLAMINNCQLPEAALKKKHVAISFHMVREAVAAGIVAPYHVDTTDNFSDMCTKALDSSLLQSLANRVFFQFNQSSPDETDG